MPSTMPSMACATGRGQWFPASRCRHGRGSRRQAAGGGGSGGGGSRLLQTGGLQTFRSPSARASAIRLNRPRRSQRCRRLWVVQLGRLQGVKASGSSCTRSIDDGFTLASHRAAAGPASPPCGGLPLPLPPALPTQPPPSIQGLMWLCYRRLCCHYVAVLIRGPRHRTNALLSSACGLPGAGCSVEQ